MNKELLMPFCSTDERRPSLMEPFTRDGFTWASDGRIMLRVPIIDGIGDLPKLPKIAACWDGYTEATDYGPLPDRLPPLWVDEDCEQCGGSGVDTCHACNHENECKECGGSGILRNDPRWMAVNGCDFAVRYLLKIAALSGARMQVFPKSAMFRNGFMRFAFDSGEGILAARSRDFDDSKNEWKPEPNPQPESPGIL